MPDNQIDKAVSPELLDVIAQIQALPAFENFALAGGTNLAIRFNHRRSIDIDLFTNSVIGITGLETMKRNLENHFGEGLVFCEILDPENGEQFCFMRALIATSHIKIKIEAIQNIQFIDPFEVYNGIRMLSIRDIALLKLLSASSRKAKKDIYDLDLLSNELNLEHLIELLRTKLEKYDSDEFENLFDLDGRHNPVENLALLLGFDENTYSEMPNRPNHSHDNIDIMPDSKSWVSARISWKQKVKDLMRKKGIIPPSAKPVN